MMNASRPSKSKQPKKMESPGIDLDDIPDFDDI